MSDETDTMQRLGVLIEGLRDEQVNEPEILAGLLLVTTAVTRLRLELEEIKERL